MAGSPSSSPSSSKCVAILLGTWNGGPYLLPQLQSFAAQTHANWRLYVSDDGSSDETLAVIARFAATVPQPVEVIAGPRRGFAANFLGLARNPAIQGDYFALSDQDDIWHPDKLERAVAWMATAPDDEPALYFSRTALIEANGTIDSIDEWGKRRLAYPINDENEGVYTVINFTSEPDFPAELDRVYKITEGVMRSLIVAKED